MDNRQPDKQVAGEIHPQGKVFKWLDNFWYHYKWPTIFVVFFVIVGLVVGLQACRTEKFDFFFVYAGGYDVSREEEAEMESSLESLAVSDTFPAPNVALTSYFLMTQDQITRYQQENAGSGSALNTSLISSNQSTFQSEVLSGQSVIFLMDEELYLEVSAESQAFVAVRSYLPDVPVSALSGDYGIYLRDTVLATMNGFSSLPGNTVICIRTAVNAADIFRQEEARENHLRYEEIFRRLTATATE